ncbi:hypothetical protein EJ06DRAFT_264870 [Trichodelitschia bisporula]|uniref:Uncharacterized protein n=1 Tax=Trichodelitschia bisporula TaxID=703511 RepID=A0A6G1HI92_9PEZI|nr:hypothetical protein EJ06DRAFT_264870 [Trichodelitschia bisporula]
MPKSSGKTKRQTRIAYLSEPPAEGQSQRVRACPAHGAAALYLHALTTSQLTFPPPTSTPSPNVKQSATMPEPRLTVVERKCRPPKNKNIDPDAPSFHPNYARGGVNTERTVCMERKSGLTREDLGSGCGAFPPPPTTIPGDGLWHASEQRRGACGVRDEEPTEEVQAIPTSTSLADTARRRRLLPIARGGCDGGTSGGDACSGFYITPRNVPEVHQQRSVRHLRAEWRTRPSDTATHPQTLSSVMFDSLHKFCAHA